MHSKISTLTSVLSFFLFHAQNFHIRPQKLKSNVPITIVVGCRFVRAEFYHTLKIKNRDIKTRLILFTEKIDVKGNFFQKLQISKPKLIKTTFPQSIFAGTQAQLAIRGLGQNIRFPRATKHIKNNAHKYAHSYQITAAVTDERQRHSFCWCHSRNHKHINRRLQNDK